MKKQIIRFAIVLVMLITFLENNENVQAAKSVKIKLEKASVTLYVGEYTTIKPKLKNATKAQKEKAKYTYKSSNKSVAQVTKKGVLNAKKKGTAVITVTSNASKKQKATFKVVVKAKPKPAIEVPIENYYYAGLLRNMIDAPELFWSKSACDFNKAETNEFAIVDINNDGEKELLVQYDDLTPGAWVRSIDIFQKDSLIKVLAFERTYSKYYQANTEFYRDGTIITQSDLDGYLYLVGYKNNVQIAEAYVWDKSLPENYYDREFPAEYDKNGDGKVYVWRDYENGLQIREVYLTDEEYDKKIAGLTEGKEKINIEWKNITEANIQKATLGDIEDEKVVDKIENNDYLAAYIKIFDNPYEKLDSLYQVIKYIAFSSNNGLNETMMTDLLPSSKISGNDYEITIYEIKKEDFAGLSKEAFNSVYTMEDLLENEWVKDNGNGTLEVSYTWMGVDDLAYKNYVLSTEKKNGKIIVKGVLVEAYEILKADYFECVFEENANSPMDGYKVISVKKEPLYEHSFYKNDF